MFLNEIQELSTGKYRQYLEKAKEMDKRRMLSLLVDMYMDYCGVSLGYRTVVYDLGWEVFLQYIRCGQTEFTGDEAFCEVMPRFNPEYTEEYDEYDVWFLDDDKYPPLCMEILDEYAGDDEKCAALCYGLFCKLVLRPNQEDEAEMWTAETLLDLMLHYRMIQTEHADDVEFLKHLHEKVVAVVKAFDMYVETVIVYNKTFKEETKFRIEDLFEGNFLSKRSKDEICALLQELAGLTGNRDFRKLHVKYDSGELTTHGIYSVLGAVFGKMLEYRGQLYGVNTFCLYAGSDFFRLPLLKRGNYIAEKLLEKYSMKTIKASEQKIDAVLLKFIGEKEPVSRKVLKEKFGFPDEYKREIKSSENSNIFCVYKWINKEYIDKT